MLFLQKHRPGLISIATLSIAGNNYSPSFFRAGANKPASNPQLGLFQFEEILKHSVITAFHYPEIILRENEATPATRCN